MLVPGKYTAEPENADDFKLYVKSIYHFKSEIEKNTDEDVFYIVQSRKGPRLFEFLFTKEERRSMNVVTEHALPFLFNNLSEDPDKKYTFRVIDDAIYFGTTIENLLSEIKEYKKLYGLNTSELEVYTVIKSKESKEIQDVPIHTNREIRKGYSHFFVNLLMSDLMSEGNCMEVEFPIVSYCSDRPVSGREICEAFKNEYGSFASVYPVPDYSSDRLPRDGVCKFSILFEEGKALFSKIRFYIKDNTIRMACMMPYNLVDDSVFLEHVFDLDNDDIRGVWEKVTSIINNQGLNVPYVGSIVRNRQRTLIILANYLLSLKLFFREYKIIDNVIGKYINIENPGPTLDKTELKYLLGDDVLVDDFYCLFISYLAMPDLSIERPFPWKSAPSITQVFETLGYPGDLEKQQLQDFNSRMVYNSKNTGEALSALFFNQTVLVEKWYRSFNQTSNYRLKFGYNFQGLNHALLTDRNPDIPELTPVDTSFIHAWVDSRVDRGCVVPQYIINHEKNHWDRVFRPGECEEALLSTLTRFVTFVLQAIQRAFDERSVTETVFNKILSVVVANVPHDMSDILRIKLIPSVKGLSFTDIGRNNDQNDKRRDVVQYLKDMFVLTIANDSIGISKRFYNTEQTIHTTFSSDIEKEIVCVLSLLKEEVDEYGFSLYQSYRVCNRNLLHLYNKEEEKQTLIESSRRTNIAIQNILAHKPDKDVFSQLKIAYELVKCFILPDDFDFTNQDVILEKYQKGFAQIDFYINLIMFSEFAPDAEMLPNYLKRASENKILCSDKELREFIGFLQNKCGKTDLSYNKPSLNEEDLIKIMAKVERIGEN